MALIVEDGSGLAAADSYLAVVAATEYWQNRSHSRLGEGWLAAADGAREGALREAAAWLDGRWEVRLSGERLNGRDQALAWPRRGAEDRSGAAIAETSIPREVLAASAELAARALIAPLDPDRAVDGSVAAQTVKVDAVSTSTRFRPGMAGPVLPMIDRLMLPLCRPNVLLGSGFGGGRLVRG